MVKNAIDIIRSVTVVFDPVQLPHFVPKTKIVALRLKKTKFARESVSEYAHKKNIQEKREIWK